jgi:hypothetical protein
MSKKKRNKIKVPLGVHLGTYDFDCTIDEAIQKLQDWKDRFPDKVLFLDGESDYDGDWRLTLQEERLENDSEYEKRIALEAARAEQQRRRELEQLAFLQSRYGSK